jgi:hypothetical protein
VEEYKELVETYIQLSGTVRKMAKDYVELAEKYKETVNMLQEVSQKADHYGKYAARLELLMIRLGLDVPFHMQYPRQWVEDAHQSLRLAIQEYN